MPGFAQGVAVEARESFYKAATRMLMAVVASQAE